MAPSLDIPNEEDYKTLIKLADAVGIKYSSPKQEQIADLDRSNWIVIPYEFTGGKYSLEVSPGRLSSNSAVERVGKELEVNYKNTSKDSLERGFIGNNNFYQFQNLSHGLGKKVLSLREVNDFGRLLSDGMQEKIKVYDVSGKQLEPKYLKQIFDDIFKIQSPWRAEYIDADFKIQKEDLIINYHIFENGKIVQKSEVLDKNTLMKNKTPGISLENWLCDKNTSQGLPTNKTKSGDLYYWAPMKDNNSVARFDAYNDRTFLNCSRYPSNRNAILGVRSCFARKN